MALFLFFLELIIFAKRCREVGVRRVRVVLRVVSCGNEGDMESIQRCDEFGVFQFGRSVMCCRCCNKCRRLEIV